MKLNELRNIEAGNVSKEIAARKEELMKLRFESAMGQLEKLHRVKQLRKEVAQLLTLQAERQRQGGDK